MRDERILRHPHPRAEAPTTTKSTTATKRALRGHERRGLTAAPLPDGHDEAKRLPWVQREGFWHRDGRRFRNTAHPDDHPADATDPVRSDGGDGDRLYDDAVRSRDRFTGEDQQYLREVQYGDPRRLTARANLHAKYGTAAVSWFPWMAAQLAWPPEGAVLEVGCGPGWLWADEGAALPAGLWLTLTDLSPGMVEVAGERVRSLDRFDLIETCEADAQQLPFDDRAFDVVVANHMLYHVPEPVRAVAELARVLRADGVLMAATVGRRHLRELWEIRAEVFGGPPVNRTAEVFGSVTGAAILRRSFATVEWRAYDDELRCTEPDDVVAALTSTPPGEDASPAQVQQLRQAVQRRFDAGDGVLVISKETGVLLGRDPSRLVSRPPESPLGRPRPDFAEQRCRFLPAVRPIGGRDDLDRGFVCQRKPPSSARRGSGGG